jgi:hypothetical protein
MRLLRTALADLPEVSAPRSFALTPEMVARPARERVANGPGPAFIAMRVAGAGVAAALAVVVLIDRGGGTDYSGDDDMAAFAPAADGGERGGDLDDSSAPEMSITQNIESTEPAADSVEDGMDRSSPSAQPVDVSAGDDSGGNGTAGGGSGGGGTAGGVGGAPSDAGEATLAPGASFQFMVDMTSTDSPVIDDRAGDDMGDEGAEALTDSLDDDDGGIGRMTVLQIALAVVAAGALAGGFVLPLFLKRD